MQKFSNQFAADELAAVIEEFSAAGLQSDQRFTESLVRHRSSQGYGPRRILMELQHKGIAAALAEGVLAEHPQDWVLLAQQVRQKRFGALPRAGLDFKARAKQYRYLSQRGFEESQIHQALEQAIEAFE